MARRHAKRPARTAAIIVVSRGPRRPDSPAPPRPPHGHHTPAPPKPRPPVLGLPMLLQAAVKEAARLEKQPRWAIALKGAAPDQPTLVQRLDRPGEYYAIVGFRLGTRLSARLRLDAHDARPGAAMGIEARTGSLSPFRTADDARTALAPPPRGGISSDAVVVDPFLVWRPCAQSPNAFMPFYRVRRKAKQRFYRIDGMPFDVLSQGAGV